MVGLAASWRSSPLNSSKQTKICSGPKLSSFHCWSIRYAQAWGMKDAESGDVGRASRRQRSLPLTPAVGRESLRWPTAQPRPTESWLPEAR